MSEPIIGENDASAQSVKPKLGVLSLVIKDKTVLYSAYMNPVVPGGLFIPTNKAFELGEEISLLITLMEEPEKLPVSGKIVWITPKNAQGNRAPGIGIQFLGDEGEKVSNKMKAYLGDLLNSNNPTHTF